MIPSILFQDDDLMVIDKPPGMVVNRAESVKGETVEEWAEKQPDCHSGLPARRCYASSVAGGRAGILKMPDQVRHDNVVENSDLISDFVNRAGIVHRIDKETSGILLIAKNPESFIELQRQFKERLVKKTYLALVHGTIAEEGTINAPVGRLPWNREHFGVVPGGKESVTRFKRVTSCELRVAEKNEIVSLVEVYPETGRTHQIRVHFKYIGHPLLGDYLYAGRVQSRDDRKEIPRVMLHAWKISFAHPKTGLPLAYEAPIPDDMRRIIPSSTNYE